MLHAEYSVASSTLHADPRDQRHGNRGSSVATHGDRQEVFQVCLSADFAACRRCYVALTTVQDVDFCALVSATVACVWYKLYYVCTTLSQTSNRFEASKVYGALGPANGSGAG